MSREGYHWLPPKAREERNERIVRLFDSGVACRVIAQIMGLTYWGTRSILLEAGRMGELTNRPADMV